MSECPTLESANDKKSLPKRRIPCFELTRTGGISSALTSQRLDLIKDIILDFKLDVTATCPTVKVDLLRSGPFV